jgi:hypothetical protein
MAEEHARQLAAAREKLVAERRQLAEILAKPHERGQAEVRANFVTVQENYGGHRSRASGRAVAANPRGLCLPVRASCLPDGKVGARPYWRPASAVRTSARARCERLLYWCTSPSHGCGNRTLVLHALLATLVLDALLATTSTV